jgi:hypothetical protein
MPVTKELIGADALADLTGKTFSLQGVGTGKGVTLIPSPGPDGVAAGHKILLSKGTAIEGIAKAGAAAVPTPAPQVVAGKVAATPLIPPGLVEIEGAGKVIGLGKGTTTISALEITGTLQPGVAGGTKVMLTGGEMKVAQAAGAAANAGKGAAVIPAGNGVVMAQGAAANAGAGNTTIIKGVAGTNANGGISTIASKAATAGKVPAVTGGTLWGGKGLSLGLGLGLGAWGPIILATALATGGYAYYRKRQAGKFWPF